MVDLLWTQLLKIHGTHISAASLFETFELCIFTPLLNKYKAHLSFSKIAFDQRSHHLLGGASGTNKWKNILPVSLLCITDPP